MHTVNIHEAKTQLSWLVAQAVQGVPFVKVVVAISNGSGAPTQKQGFIQRIVQSPPDFDRTGNAAMEALFTGTAP